jgi:sulfate adenylyltransferase subunit 1
MVKEVHYRVNISDLEKDYTNLDVCMNDIARVSIRTTKPLFFDSYSVNRTTGSLILIDEATNETVAAGMIV